MAKTLAEKLKERKKAAKERAKAAREAYLARPDIQRKLLKKKEKLRQLAAAKRKKLAELRKSKRLAEKKAFQESQKLTRANRQQARDQELADCVSNGASLLSKLESTKEKPKLTVIHGGLSEKKGKTTP